MASKFQHTENVLRKTQYISQYISLLSIKINDLLFSKDFLFGLLAELQAKVRTVSCYMSSRKNSPWLQTSITSYIIQCCHASKKYG